MKKESKFDIYEMITNQIVQRIEESGKLPWSQPWDITENTPINLITKRAYSGINFWLFLSLRHERPYYLSYKQIREIGGTLKENAKSFHVIFWKIFTFADQDENGNATGGIKKVPYLRYFNVYHVDDCENIPEKYFPAQYTEREFTPIQSCKKVVENWGKRPIVKHGSPNACYVPSFDEVRMPYPQYFHSGEHYYSTLFHELTHSTGHAKRLDRFSKMSSHKFGSKDYSFEELVAEMGASFLCGYTGIENKTIDNSAAYIQNWLRSLKNDKKLLFNAASKAQKAVDLILSNEE